MSHLPEPLDTHQHDHEGVHNMTWDEFGALCRDLAMRVWAEYRPDAVVGIAKGGVLVGACLSSALRVDFFPIKLSSRHQERIVRDVPRWYVRPTRALAGKRVLLVDDMCVSRRTLDMAREAILAKGAREVRTAALMVHGDSRRPDWYALDTDALILVPWELAVIEDGAWILHPEFRDEMDRMELPPDFDWPADLGATTPA